MLSSTRITVDGGVLLWVSARGDARKVGPQCVLQSHLLHELANTSGASEDAVVPLDVHAFHTWIEHVQGKGCDDVPVNKARDDEADLAHGEQSVDASATSAGLGAAAHAPRKPAARKSTMQPLVFRWVKRFCRLIVVRTASTHTSRSELEDESHPRQSFHFNGSSEIQEFCWEGCDSQCAVQAADVLIDEVTRQSQSTALASVLQRPSTPNLTTVADMVRTRCHVYLELCVPRTFSSC